MKINNQSLNITKNSVDSLKNSIKYGHLICFNDYKNKSDRIIISKQKFVSESNKNNIKNNSELHISSDDDSILHGKKEDIEKWDLSFLTKVQNFNMKNANDTINSNVFIKRNNHKHHEYNYEPYKYELNSNNENLDEESIYDNSNIVCNDTNTNSVKMFNEKNNFNDITLSKNKEIYNNIILNETKLSPENINNRVLVTNGNNNDNERKESSKKQNHSTLHSKVVNENLKQDKLKEISDHKLKQQPRSDLKSENMCDMMSKNIEEIRESSYKTFNSKKSTNSKDGITSNNIIGCRKRKQYQPSRIYFINKD